MFHSLRYRNYRIFFAGQSVSLVGTWVQHIAMSWLVYRLTNSALLLGLVAFLSQIPTFILMPFAGVIADRIDKRRILLTTQVLSMLQAFILAFLTISGIVAVWHLVILGILLGCVNSLDIPARQSFVIEMIEEKRSLGNAIALNSFMFNLARFVGPSIAGILIGIFGEGPCFLLNGVSFLAVIASLIAMDIKRRGGPANGHPPVLKALREGFDYAFGFLPIRYMLLLLGIISIAGMSYVVLMPVFARDILGGGPSTLGLLMGSVGIGAVAGTIFLAARKESVKLGKIIPLSSLIFAVGLMTFSTSHSIFFSSLLLAITGFGLLVHMVSANTILQMIVEDDKRGRIMGFYAAAFIGLAPFGSLLAGTLANKIGAPNTIMLGGVMVLIAAVIFAAKLAKMQRLVHPIYEKIRRET